MDNYDKIERLECRPEHYDYSPTASEDEYRDSELILVIVVILFAVLTVVAGFMLWARVSAAITFGPG